MTQAKDIWAVWDSAWELDLSDSERLKRLQNGTVPDFIYTNPTTKISGDLKKLSEYITPAIEAGGGNIKVKHLDWYENNNRCALHWDMIDQKSGKAVLRGWSFGEMNAEGKLITVADFW